MCIRDRINPLYSRSCTPLNCHDDTLEIQPANEPTITIYCSFLKEIAGLMPRLQDGIESSNTLFTRYEQLLKYDRKMRSLTTAERPSFLSNSQIEPHWPIYVPWARRAAATSSSHKIIMINRKFLSMSFTNNAFIFSRRTCIAASRTILKEFRQAAHEDGPILWIYHAFSVAASITLCLDVLHCGSTTERSEHSEHECSVHGTVTFLQRTQGSTIASRGAKLLWDLLTVIRTLHAKQQSANLGKRYREQSSYDTGVTKRHKAANIHEMLHSVQNRVQSTDTVVGDSTGTRHLALSRASQEASDLHAGAAVGPDPAVSGEQTDFGLSFGVEAFAGANDIFSSLHAGFAGNSNDAFGSLLSLSQSYNYV